MIHEIKQRINCVDYARSVLNLNISKGDRTYSLSKGDNKTCLSIYNDFWYDFKLFSRRRCYRPCRNRST